MKSEGRREVKMVRASYIVGLPSIILLQLWKGDETAALAVENGEREAFVVQFMQLKALALSKYVDAEPLVTCVINLIITLH